MAGAMPKLTTEVQPFEWLADTVASDEDDFELVKTLSNEAKYLGKKLSINVGVPGRLAKEERFSDFYEEVLKVDADNRLKYLIRKGSFPHEFSKSLSNYSLPNLVSKEAFYTSITRTHITEEKYKLAKEIWNVFDMKCMKDYMEIYCMCDTLLLAEVFEAFRYESLNNFEIDPTHFISLPGFAYSAFLKVTKVSLDYITDPEIFDMLSSNLRGGHSFCSQRYGESTLFKSGLLCEENQATYMDQHLLYIDANNL